MTCLVLMTICYVAGAVGSLGLPTGASRRLSSFAAAAGGVFGGVAALRVLITGQPVAFAVPSFVPFLSLPFRLDPLGAFFLGVIALVAIPAAIYGDEYLRGGPEQSPALVGAMLNLFLLAMSLATLAAGVLAFLMLWEGMSLASYFLVIAEGDSGEGQAAGRWYAGMAHAGFVLIAAALLMAGIHTSGLGFDEIRHAASALGPGTRNVIFLLALAGFGSKAGLVPLHVWLPRAHPAAPSHVSAILSGAMLKMGVYGILRIALDLLGGGPAWWGGLLLALGAASALLGVLYALMEHDLKRLLAYHSVENVGIIFMGVGLGLLLHSNGFEKLAALALVAAIYHTLNHAAFKGLLFLGAGAVARATGTRNMEEMGGLIKRMPQTAACFLVGSAAIAALPPLNGFASEWMLFQSLLSGARAAAPLSGALIMVCVGALALTGGLAAACFVKAFGIPFLALPRSRAAEEARDVGALMRGPMIALAAVCAALGVLPFVVVPFVARALMEMPGIDASGAGFTLRLSLSAAGGSSRISPLAIALLLALAVAAVPLLLRLMGASRRRRAGDLWGCGRVAGSARMEYTSSAFAEPLKRVFADLYRPTADITVEVHPESGYFTRSIHYHSRVRVWFEEVFYQPLFNLVKPLGSFGRLIQSGSVHLYLVYIFAALLIFLLLAR
ncbi:MAG TPA: hydrogenase 4 subunit B [Candidatus Polarisedimenticolia bacterium]|jgi:hydrogenase-4 component B|nr:hydrogenase 4 subunit B [Candidatus Polarisedimenticolia bacterium]